jgi:hypothetical protein
MSTPLYAVQHVRKMRGGSQAHLMRASDGQFYVVKFVGNPQHTRILANEMFATQIGAWLGLPMPRMAVIDVSDWLIRHTPELRTQIGGREIPCSSGLQFGSLYPCDPTSDPVEIFDYLPQSVLEKTPGLISFARILVLDKWLANADGRQAIFTRRHKARRFGIVFIDHGYCFNAGEWDFSDSALRGVYASNCVYRDVTGWESFEPVLTKAEQVSMLDLWRCAESIPPEWYEHDSEGLRHVIEGVYARRGQIRELIETFRTSSRNPFPNWTSV